MKIIIIGAGPAGVSAALYAKRAGFDTIILAQGFSALEKAEQIENFYGQAQPISGSQLYQNGIAQAKNLGIEVIETEVVGLNYTGEFEIATGEETYTANAVIVATGSPRRAPKIEGLSDLEGKGVSYCAVCDGFIYRKKQVAVLGFGEYALHEANALENLVDKVTILSDGNEVIEEISDKFEVINNKIKRLVGNEKIEKVEFENGEVLDIAALFVAQGSAGSADLARKIGAIIDKNRIVVDDSMQTNVPGLFAAGDCTGGLLQISKAVYEGTVAALSAIKFLRK